MKRTFMIASGLAILASVWTIQSSKSQQFPYRSAKTTTGAAIGASDVSQYYVAHGFSSAQRGRLIDFAQRFVDLLEIEEHFEFPQSKSLDDLGKLEWPWLIIVGFASGVADNVKSWRKVFEEAEQLSRTVIKKQKRLNAGSNGVQTETVWFYPDRRNNILNCEIDLLYERTRSDPDVAKPFAFVVSINAGASESVLDFCVLHAILIRMGIELQLSAVNAELLGRRLTCNSFMQILDDKTLHIIRERLN